ncbi:BnaA10g29600D [Brassica napus]|uniref:(rape) hypothetical protein n=1 Tax=Brassica napus TaxID=3708 RepID=A0A078JVA7_BRANA|nr:unnamed protein product [Brassica napus]CDY69427.1 BnaA10g29600D [Brassica napus]
MLEYLYTPWRESFLNRCFLQNDNLIFFYLLVVLQAQLLKACGTTPATPVSEQTPSSCITDSQNSAKISTGYSHAREESQGSIGAAFMDGVDITTKLPLTATGKRKSVRFECDFDQSYLYIGLGCHYYGNERAQVRILVIHNFSHKPIFHTPYGRDY